MNTKFKITGMSCAACQNHVETAVRKLDNIISADVSLLLNQMVCEYNSPLTVNDIINAVEEAGYGAEIYDDSINKDNNELSERKRRLVLTLCFMLLLWYVSMSPMLNLPLFSFVNYQLYPLRFAFTQFIILLIVLFINRKQLLSGCKALIKLSPTMDSLIFLGCLASVVYGCYTTYRIYNCINLNQLNEAVKLTHAMYFETGAMVLSFTSIGKYLEQLSKYKTTGAITHLLDISPKYAVVMENGIQQTKNVNEVKIDDILYIKPGAKIPVDGYIIDGHSYLDNSSLTGESMPVETQNGDYVLSGALNLNGILIMRATKNYTDSTFNQIIELVSQAASSKAPVSRLADTISLYFIPAVITLSIITFFCWYIFSKDSEMSFLMGVSVLVVSCPCALGLATPTAIMVSTGKAASMGILFKDATAIETASKIDTIVFDKTKTVTTGQMKVISFINISNQPDILDIAYCLEKTNDHPLAEAICSYCLDNEIKEIEMTDFEYLIGQGVVASYAKKKYAIGNLKLMQQLNINMNKDYLSRIDLNQGTALYFTANRQLIGIFIIADYIKPTALQTIRKLKQAYNLILLTGDNSTTAHMIGSELEIDNVISDVLPQNKQNEIIIQQKNGHKVAMIGDGINDTVALTQADIGIAVNNGTDVAIESSDVVMISNDFSDIFNLFEISRFTMKIIKENLFWALGYNCLLIPIAAGLFYPAFGLKLSPMFASMAMSLSSITVISNALRINSYKPFKAIIENKTAQYGYLLKIDLMFCQHCQKAVTEALLNLGIIAETKIPESTATFYTDKEIDENAVKKVIHDVGYEVTEIIRL